MSQQERLKKYLKENPDAAFVSWISAAFPDAVEITLDARFTIAGNPWLAIYDEAWAALNGFGSPKTNVTKKTTTTSPREWGVDMANRARKGFGFVFTRIADEAQPTRHRLEKEAARRQVDREAEEMAQQAQRMGTHLVEQHLKAFLELYPGAAYDSWIATLHPENAEIKFVDRRFQAPPGSNQWLDMYQSAKNGKVDTIIMPAMSFMSLERPGFVKRLLSN